MKSCGENYFGVEEGAGYAGGDGNEVALSVEDFDLAGAGEFGEVDGAATADAGGGGVVGGDGGKLGQELAGVDEEGFEALCSSVNGGFLIFGGTVEDSRFLHCASLSLRESEASVGMTTFPLSFYLFLIVIVLTPLVVLNPLNFVEGVSLGEVEFGYGGAAEGFEMGPGAEALAHFVGDGAHVGSGGDAGAEVGAVAVD